MYQDAHIKKKDKKPMGLIVGLIAAVLVVAVIAVVAFMELNGTENQPGNENPAVLESTNTFGEESTEPSESEDTEITNSPLQPVNGCEVETPYCTLYYPTFWADNLKAEVQMHSEGVFTVVYLCELGERTAKLFAVSFGQTEGDILGHVITEGGRQIPVSVEYFTLEETLDWSENDSSFAHAMRDASEELVSTLMSDARFTPAQ